MLSSNNPGAPPARSRSHASSCRSTAIFVSYSLSMIPGWEKTVSAALAALAPGGSLHVVDFGQQEGLPNWFRTLLRGWLKKFHVSPRESLREVLESESRRTGAAFRFRTFYRGYAWLAVIKIAQPHLPLEGEVAPKARVNR